MKYEEKVEIIKKYLEEGKRTSEISRLMNANHSTIYNIIWKTWGPEEMVAKMFPLPVDLDPSKYMFTHAERELIKKGLDSGLTGKQIAKALKRTPNQIFSEIRKGGGSKNYSIAKSKKADENKYLNKRIKDDKTNN